MKKIIFTVTNDLTYDQRMQRICRSLSRAGYVVELVGREHKASGPLKQEPYRQKRFRCYFSKGKLFYIEYNLRLLLYLLFQQADAFCAIDLDTVAPVYLAGRLKKAKLIYDAHEYFTEVPEVERRPLVQKVWQWVESTFVPRFHLTYTVSQGLADLFNTKLHRPFHVIRNVPVKTKSIHHSPNAGPYMLYQGALNEGRGLENLLQAVKELPVQLKLAGEGDLSRQLREQASQLYLDSKVEFLGFVQPEKLKAVTANASIGINILEPAGKSYYYSLANKFFDYVQAGIPQICIDFPEYRHINQQYEVAILVKNTSVSEIKNAVGRLLNDKSLYSQLQGNCAACAAALNWQNEEQKLLALYHELLG
jgi:glycosyltransferase involved in cell wall biosynthesis